MAYFDRVLIANRGEIALRVIRACRELGIATVAVYSDADAGAPHARAADQAARLGPAPAHASYLSIPAILAAAQTTGAQAIHPGYGFLAENADFAAACADAGIVFIGPPPEAIRLMGSKIAAKATAQQAGTPTVPGYQGADQAPAALLREARRIGFPVMIKAAVGGGGKGMREVTAAADFPDALAAAQREALAAFGDGTVFLEKLIVQPRHIEFQIIADRYGTGLHLGERECSIQRRHQKVIEEAPSLAVAPDLRRAMGAAAVRAALAAGYVNAGTVEFLLDRDGHYYFLEMNTRLQVEHPVTEQVSGLDLVHLQLAVAAGARLGDGGLGLAQEAIHPRGHSIEVRLYAEDPTTYLPATGRLAAFDPPVGPGIRLDGGVATGDDVTMYYDPLLAKLIVAAPDRPTAIARLAAALDEFGVLGLTTNLPLLRQIVADERFAAGQTFTDFLSDPRYAAPGREAPRLSDAVLLAAAAIVEREQAASAIAARRSPWEAGALRSGSFAVRYVLGDATRLVELRDTPGGVRATVDGQPVALPGGDPDAPLLALRSPGTAALTLRQGTAQARLWATRDPAGTATLASDGRRTLRLAPPAPPDVDRAAHEAAAGAGGSQAVTAPMSGTVIQVRVAPGDRVAARQTLVVLGAMKMEHNLTAPAAGIVRRVACRVGEAVAGGAVLVELDDAGAEATAPAAPGSPD